ncbi:MAG: hypothetical protein QOE80_4166 [Actinomycetota bacterium]|nr:hypothetical protein [Actinomycetota bacterium]
MKRHVPHTPRPLPRGRRLIPLALAGGALLVALSSSAASASVTGGCQGTGTIGTTSYDVATLDPANPITIPATGDVAYQGSVPLPAGDAKRAYSGTISLKLPFGGSIAAVNWSGSSAKVADSGVHHYSIPAFVPRGMTVRADGTHNQDGLPAPCTGAFSVKVQGGPFDSPVPTAAALGGTLLTGAALGSAAFAKGGKP